MPDDVIHMSVDPAGDACAVFLALYDRALPSVYGYLLHRCGDVSVAEDLTSEVFLAAVRSLRDGSPVDLTVAWLTGVARHKLIDHWRRREREERGLHRIAADSTHAAQLSNDESGDNHVQATLHRLPAQYRAALTLRYVDDLPVPAVAAELGRTLHATESLLARARHAFRQLYREAEDA